jgi:hypothetical protein
MISGRKVVADSCRFLNMFAQRVAKRAILSITTEEDAEIIAYYHYQSVQHRRYICDLH